MLVPHLHLYNRARFRDNAAKSGKPDIGPNSGTVPAKPGHLATMCYFPDGSRVSEFASSGTRFLVNRGPNEVINGQQFINGSVHLFRRFSAVPKRGRFHCELPNAADPSVN